jgi:hypothetical protein
VTSSLLFALFARSALAAEACPVLPPDDFEHPSTRIVLFNGMWTTFADARAEMNALRANYGSPDGEHLRYAVLYHQSSALGSITGLVETFDAMLEDEQDGALAGRFELFFSSLHCGGPWWDYIAGVMPLYRAFLERAIAREIHAATVADMTSGIDAPPTSDDFECARDQLDAWDGSDLVLVGHSDGDLFARAVRTYLESTDRAGAVASLHVAPPTPPPTAEPYVLADIDFVINGLVGASVDVPAANIEAVTNTSQLGECLGHDLGDVYLSDFELSAAIHDSLADILESMP